MVVNVTQWWYMWLPKWKNRSTNKKDFFKLFHFCLIYLCALFGECILLHEECHHVSARQELHDQVKVDGVLEGVVHFHNPLVISLNKDVPLWKERKKVKLNLNKTDFKSLSVIFFVCLWWRKKLYFSPVSYTDLSKY